MFKGCFLILPLIITTLTSTHSSAELQHLPDSKLSNLTAQNGQMSMNVGSISLSQKVYIERAKLEDLYLTNKRFADRALYFIELDKPTVADSEMLAEQLEMSLITLSTQLASTITFSSLFPLLGFPIGVGASAVPDAFNVEATDITIDINMSMNFRN